MFRMLAVLLGLSTLYIQITSDEAMTLIFIIMGCVFLAYGLGWEKWLAKIGARFLTGFNANPIDEYKKLMKKEQGTPRKPV